MSVLSDWVLTPERIRYVGRELARPECVLAMPDGSLWVSSPDAAALRIHADGRQEALGDLEGGMSNGLAADRTGGLYIADLGRGRVVYLRPDGTIRPVLEEIDGHPAGVVNFVYLDRQERLWVTISTPAEPRREAIVNPRPDGSIVVIDREGARVAMEGLWFPNELRLDAAERYCYINETTAGGVSRAPVLEGGRLGPREPFGPQPIWPGARVDGCTFDAEGNLWVTEITRNALVVIAPHGNARTVFEDPEAQVVHFPASIAFGGPELRTAYLGTTRMPHLAVFDAPVAGLPLYHWPQD